MARAGVRVCGCAVTSLRGSRILVPKLARGRSRHGSTEFEAGARGRGTMVEPQSAVDHRHDAGNAATAKIELTMAKFAGKN
jgi:hypothetical protein